MPPTTTTTRRSNPIAIGAGLLSLALGTVVLAGYGLSSREATTLLAGSAPMRVSTAIGVMLSGLALLALAGARIRFAAALAVLTALVGLEMLAESALNLPLGPWESHLWDAAAGSRRSTLTAVCLLLVALALLLMSVLRWRHRLAAAGLLGSIVASIGAVAFLSYFSGVGSAFVQGELTTMSVPTALCCLALGAAVIRFAWRDSATAQTGAPAWLPLLVLCASLAVAVTLWEAVVADAREQLDHRVAYDADYLRGELEAQIENRIQPLIRLGRRRAASLDFGGDDWEADAQTILARGGYQAIQWVDASGRSVWMTPAGAGDALPGGAAIFEPRRRAAFDQALRNRVVTLTPPLDLVNGGKGFLAVVPVFGRGDALMGYVAGVFPYRFLFAEVLPLTVTPHYSFSIKDGAEELYRHDAGRRLPEWNRREAVNLHGAAWRIELWPGDRLIEESRTSSSGALLVAGVLLSLLFALVVRLIQAGRSPQPHPVSAIAEAIREQPFPETTLPVISYGRNGALQAWNDAARSLFAAAPPPLAPADGFRILRLMVLRASPEGDLRTLLDSCSLPTLLFTPDGAFAMCNQAATRLLGWNEAQWQGRTIVRDSSGQPHAVTALLLHGQTLVARPETA